MSDQTRFSSVGFLRLPEILKLIPVSKATWWNGCRSGRFPKPYKLAPRITAWKACDIFDCIEKFKSSN
ncbi:helix-turn-helix transcriptional regulator [Dyadobacter helix]|uniref:helix-turn-helix transcriptional regulator n=1 Tax=Dyadobacter helix TaxID=2822344 RepID=UPI001BFCAEB4|nr:AlpA family phage regulatory protein [Dyadobacter sp. CECT 9275]